MVRGITSGRGYRGSAARGSAARGSAGAMYFSSGRGGRSNQVYGYVPQFVYDERGGGIQPVNNNSYFYKSGGSRFGILRGSPGYFFYPNAFNGRLRRVQNVAVDRRKRRQPNFFSGPLRNKKFFYNFGPSNMYRRQQRRSARGRRRTGRGGRVPTRAELDAQLDAYMGDDVTKNRLDSQLDTYFGRSGGHHSSSGGHEGTQDKLEPMSDPSDVTMGAPPPSRGRA